MIDVPAGINVPVLGVIVTPMTAENVAELVSGQPSQTTLVLNHNLHSTYFHYKHEWFRKFYARSRIVVIDGWPVLALASLRAKLAPVVRIGSTDWIQALWEREESQPLRVFILGGSVAVNARAVNAWQQVRPSDRVAGRSGYFSASDEADILQSVSDHNPTLVLIGLGMPKQEAFLDRHWERLPTAYIATVGGAIDYLAGAVSLSPRWLGSVGLEWAWRFIHDPRRLFTRYFIEPFGLAMMIAKRRTERMGRK